MSQISQNKTLTNVMAGQNVLAQTAKTFGIDRISGDNERQQLEESGVQCRKAGKAVQIMEFNRFLWNLYRESEAGRAAIGRDVAEHAAPELRSASAFTHQLYFYEISNGEIVENGTNGSQENDLREMVKKCAAEYIIADIDNAEKIFTEIADIGLFWQFDDEGKDFEAVFGGGKRDLEGYSDIIVSIEGLSAGLHDAHPEFFIPYLFSRRFDELENICQSFGILLPQVPGKLQKRDRALYYLAINRALYNFRKSHEISPQEFNAFLYDFAPKNLAFRSAGELPPPSRIWFVIGGVGGNGDFEYLDAVDENSVSHWQGNLETRRGDIILMWCASPRSYLHSIWRALDEGFNDPYFHFYSTIRVGNPIKITPIPFSEFSKHPLLGKMPAVRAHFQGTSGRAFAIDEYAAICYLLRENGFDLSALPLPPAVKEFFVEGLENERDVELKLLEPLLRNLGFAENDWMRQFPVRMGRGERNYPDYVLGGDPRPSEQSAIAVIECKFDINTNKDLKEAFVQAKSYALRLQTKVLALAARRGLWIFRPRDDGFSNDHFTFKTWNELAHPDVLHEVSLVIGKRAIEALITQRNRILIKMGT